LSENASLSIPVSSAYVPVTVSQADTLIYAAGVGLLNNQIGWYDRSGKSLGRVSLSGTDITPALSPDEKFVVFTRITGGRYDLWLHDLSRGTETRLSQDALQPQWSPRGDRIVFQSSRTNGVADLYQRSANGSGQDELLWSSPFGKSAFHWSRDGRFIVYAQIDPKDKGRSVGSSCRRRRRRRQTHSLFADRGI
jgi:Tol biopolymer transport system component